MSPGNLTTVSTTASSPQKIGHRKIGFRKVALIGRLLGGALLLGLASCSNTASQCGQFAGVINQSQSIKNEFENEIESAKIKAAGSQGLPELKTAAQEYTTAVQQVTGQIDSMAEDLSALNIDDEQLDEYRDRYYTILTDYKDGLGAASDSMQLVVEAKDENAFRGIFDSFQSKANSAFNSIQTLNGQESDLVGQINTYCGQQAQ